MLKQALPRAEDSQLTKPVPKSRADRRREDTRRRLMRAAYEIIAERGFEGLVIQDITQRADVGYGSFYNHFTSKEAIVSAAIEAARLHTKQMFERLDGLAEGRIEAFARDLRVWLHISKTDKIWGWFMIRTVLSGEEIRSGIGNVLRRALQAGIDDGSFRHEDVEMAHEMIAGLLLLGTLKLVSAEVPDDYADKIVSSALKTLCVADGKIREVMTMPLPELEMEPFLEAAA